MKKTIQPVKHGNKWRIRPIDANGKRILIVCDTLEQAELELEQFKLNSKKVKLGLIPGFETPNSKPKQKPQAQKTFNDLADYWELNRVPFKRSGAREDMSILRQLRPEFGNLKLTEIGIEQIDQYKRIKKDRDPQTVNNHLKLLSSMFVAALDLKWVTEKPKIKKYKVPKYRTDYRYLRSREEIESFLLKAYEHSEYCHALYATAIYTGMRLGELAALKKSNVDFEKRFIMVDSSFHGPTKNEGIRFVPILDPILPVLKTWILKTPGQLVFPNAAGNMHQPSARIFQEDLHKILEKAGFPELNIKGKSRSYIRFHDLRHTFASHWMMSGGCIFRLQKILGHHSPEMTQRYSHLSPDVYSQDYQRLGSRTPGFSTGSIHSIKLVKENG